MTTHRPALRIVSNESSPLGCTEASVKHAIAEVRDMITEAEMGAPSRVMRAVESDLVIQDLANLLRKLRTAAPAFADDINAALRRANGRADA